MITLVCGKQKREFSEQQAQGILYIQKQMKLKGWELPKDSPYEFKDNALIKRANTGDCKAEAKPKASKRGDKPSEQA